MPHPAPVTDTILPAGADLDGVTVLHAGGAQVKFSPMADPRPEPPQMPTLRAHLLPQMRHRAAQRGIRLFNGPCVDLVSASLTAGVGGQMTYNFTPAPATYFDFALTTARLDEPVPGQEASLRQVWGYRPWWLADVSALPAVAKVGVSVVPVTNDGQVVMGVRGATFIAGGNRRGLHVVAEGLEPTDTGDDGLLDPQVAARRGLSEELGAGEAHIAKMELVGIFFDRQRWQPGFTYLAHLNLTWDELAARAEDATDSWEASQLVKLAWHDLDRLIAKQHPWWEPVSNHATAALWAALNHARSTHHPAVGASG